MKIVNDEVWLRAASMAEGYWRNGQRVPLVNDEGWYATRDRGEMHNGKLTIVGRLDNLFFSGGEVFSRKKSSALLLHIPAVLQVFIVPVADKEFGHRPVAVVEYDQQTVDLDEWVKDKLARFQQPVRWLTLPPELKTAVLKFHVRR